jgi:hypothetical protein
MKLRKFFTCILLIIVCLPIISACGKSAVETEATGEESSVTVEHLTGANPTRLTLTAQAVQRLDIQTAEAQGNAIPYAAVLYDPEGNTWIYTNPEPLTYVRSPIMVDYIEEGQAFLTAGPDSGSAVVTVGAEELYGSETEFEEE